MIVGASSYSPRSESPEVEKATTPTRPSAGPAGSCFWRSAVSYHRIERGISSGLIPLLQFHIAKRRTINPSLKICLAEWARPLLPYRPLEFACWRACSILHRRHAEPVSSQIGSCAASHASLAAFRLVANRARDRHQSNQQPGGSSCRKVRREIRKKRNRRQTRSSLRSVYRPTNWRKARASRSAILSRKRPDSGFGRARGWPTGWSASASNLCQVDFSKPVREIRRSCQSDQEALAPQFGVVCQ